MTSTKKSGAGRKPATHDPAELRKRLNALLGDDTLAYVDLDLPTQSAPDEARKKHKARTASYKQAQALLLAPDSEAVRQATSNVLLSVLLANGPDGPDLFRRALRELIDAGYDLEESRNSLLRLLSGYGDLREAWQRRNRQKLARAIAKELLELDQ